MALAETAAAQPRRQEEELVRLSLLACLAGPEEPGPGRFPASRFQPQVAVVEEVGLRPS